MARCAVQGKKVHNVKQNQVFFFLQTVATSYKTPLYDGNDAQVMSTIAMVLPI